MKVGMIGLGKMGMNLAENLQKNGYHVMGYDISEEARKKAAEKGICTTETVEALCEKEGRTILWVMLPAGEITNHMLETLLPIMQQDDILIEGGNSRYRSSMAWAERFTEKGIHFFDVGTSGGISGANQGACLMIGGEETVFTEIECLFKDLSCEDGYLYCGKAGSGHFLKMVHNGIEYGMMQAMGEGFEVVEKSEFGYDLEKVAKVWNHGSVIRSWLMELAQSAFQKDAKLEQVKGVVKASGEAQWTLEEALEKQISTPVIALSLMTRYATLEEDLFSAKVVASLRNEFGGHGFTKK